MKRFKRLAFVLIIALLSVSSIFLIKGNISKSDENKNIEAIKSTEESDEIQESKESLPEVPLSFAVLGDIHENTTKFNDALKDLYGIRHKMDALILNGDVVDQGSQEQYDSMTKALNNNKKTLPKEIIKNIGNHEFFNYQKGTNSQADVDEFLGRYYKFSGEDKVYHDKWINGYHFISLGSENTYTEEINSVRAFISDEQMTWFKNKLSEGREKGKPIFVFLHQPTSGAITGSAKVDQGKDLKNILSRYPEVVIFESHMHPLPENNNVTLNQPYTTVQTGAIHYTITRNDKGERENRTDLSYGVYVEVNGNKVTVKGRDFKNKTWVYSKEIQK